MIDAEAVARVVEGCPSVSRLTSGPGVEVATYLQGRRVPGVRLAEGRLEVHVAARYGPPMPAVAEEIRQALAGYIGGARVAVFIDELDVDGSDDEDIGAKGSDVKGSDVKGSDVNGSDVKGSDVKGSDVNGSDVKDVPAHDPGQAAGMGA